MLGEEHWYCGVERNGNDELFGMVFTSIHEENRKQQGFNLEPAKEWGMYRWLPRCEMLNRAEHEDNDVGTFPLSIYHC